MATSNWMTPCGVAYRWSSDGRFEVEGLGFPDYAVGSFQEKILANNWDKWGAYVKKGAQASSIPASWLMAVMYTESGGKTHSAAACNELCSSVWSKGGCASQGGSATVCAGGLMGFIPQTAATYGRTIDWYVASEANEGQQIIDAADVIVKNIARFKGDVLAGLKAYNGGSPCRDTGASTGPGIMNMYGQGNYVEKIVRLSNTFARMQLADPATSEPISLGQGAVVALVIGSVGYMFADIHWNLTSRILRWLGK